MSKILDRSSSSHFRISIVALFTLLILCVSSAWSATISGKVTIEGRQDISGVLVTVQAENLSSITDKDGTYSMQNVPSGSFTLIAQKPGCLVAIRSDVVVGSGAVVVDFQLIPGDLKMDNQINLLDRIMLTSAWQARKGDPNWNDLLDIYEDGVIDEKDKDLLLSHWRKGNPGIKLGLLEILSEPAGANILVNGADTGETTPHTFPAMVIGKYVIALTVEGYAPEEATAQIKADETTTLALTLDDQPPEFVDWVQDPADLTEDSQGRFRVTVRVVDKGGSGLEGITPQIDYHIGADNAYDGYENMTRESGDVWYYDIDEPVESWNAYRGKYVYYKVNAEDVAGNKGESDEQRERIDDINDSPMVRITSTYSKWERGLLTVSADASDTDGSVAEVLFEYSFDNASWTKIGFADTTAPYSVSWDTSEAVREVVSNAWIRATASDDDNDSSGSTTTSFGIDNQPPVTSHDYDGVWHNEDFVISLKADDGDGIGVASISYKLNYGNKQDVLINGQASAPVNITTENLANVLEYWSVDELGNEGSHRTLTNIKLDKTAPIFSDWKQSPDNLTEDSTGMFSVSVRVADGDGSGLAGNTPQIDYSIGSVAQYDGYEDMATEDGNVWHFDIPEPPDTWNAHRGEYVHYIVRSADIAGNERESIGTRELIDDINDPPVVNVTSKFNDWEKGLLTIAAEASDSDGTIAGVQFEYSPDGSTWIPIGSADTEQPFSVEWDTTASASQAQTVFLRATATDDGGASASDAYPASVGIDNQAPVTVHDYDDQWHTMDFAITLDISDGEGIGVSLDNVKYKLNDGDEKNLSTDGQPWIANEGTSQLEYWSMDDLDNAEAHHILRNINLDKTSPTFNDWFHDPGDLTEDSSGALQVSVRVIDTGGSGLTGTVPQFSYRIGRDAQFSQYESMTTSGADDVWYYDIPEPVETWDAYRGQDVYYKVKAQDLAGNEAESAEQKELINDINDYPTVTITSAYNKWVSGTLTIEAISSDIDGTINGVQFDYSPNQVVWTPIGTLITAPPYSITWDTTASIPEVEKDVWIRATTTDDDDQSVQYTIQDSLNIDNEAPVMTHDYNGLWHNEDFAINLTSGDQTGVGIASVSYRLNYGEAQETEQASASVSFTTESANNILEYWSVDKLGNEGAHETLSSIKLDKTAPVFSDWLQDPVDLTEDTEGRFRVSVQATDAGGSGLEGKVLQIDYRIGTDSQYDGYENMASGSWHFDIPEPSETWNAYRGEYVYYKVRIEDIAGNVAEEDPEKSELIDSVNDEPVVAITSAFNDWETAKKTITADATDVDGSTPVVQFEYSVNATDWTPVGVAISAPPYSVEWDTATAIPELEQTVWIKAAATDADDTSVLTETIILKSFGVDNQPPTLSDWTQLPVNLTEDTEGALRVQVNVDDGTGSGVAKVELSYRISDDSGDLLVRSFRDMTKGADNSWYYDIPEPGSKWDTYRGKTLYYKGRATDAVGNESQETAEQQDLIDDINDPPRGVITSTFKDWERGTLTIIASAVDDDGDVTGVQFQYSPDNINWMNIGQQLINKPYTVTWDTTGIAMDPDVWLQIVVTDNNGAVAKAPYPKSIGIDNAIPAFAGWQHTELTEDSTETFFRVEVEITDQGSGVNSNKVQLDYRIGTTGYTGYRDMFKKSGDVWFFEIFAQNPWSSYADKTLYYKVRTEDIAGNAAESAEQKEFIEPTTGSLSGIIAPRASWFRNAKVAAKQNSITVKQVLVSQIDGSYSITGLRPGAYDLAVTAIGYGTDNSMTSVAVSAGADSPNHNVTLHTYAVAELTSAQGGSVEYKDDQLKEYKLIAGSNVLGTDGKVVLGFSDKEPTSVPNPEVHLLGKAIGVGYKGRNLNGDLQLIMPRPAGITDGDAVMTFIYDGQVSSYRFADRNNIATTDQTVTITITPDDVWSFSDENHDFDEVLSRTADTVFYVLITKFDEPQINLSELGILDPQTFSGGISGYNQPNIGAGDLTVALVIHGITSTPDDLAGIIDDLRSLNYYDHVLVFNYDASNAIASSGSSFISELASVLPGSFAGKVDVIAHGMGGLVARTAIVASGDDYIGSLTMLGTPHGGADERLLKTGFADFLLKTQSEPAWTYYQTGWRDMLTGSAFLLALNSQSGRDVDTHYYGIAASNPGATTDNDDLAYVASMDFMTGFANMEQGATEAFEKVVVAPPVTEGTSFMSQSRHVAMLDSNDVRGKITTYLQGASQNVKYERYDGELIPGQRVETFTVEVENVGTETVYGVSGQLSTQNIYIRKYSGEHGVENDTADFGDIIAGATASGTFSFDVSSSAVAGFGEQVTFKLLIRNTKDNSVNLEEFSATIGGNIIKIALDINDNKMVNIDVAEDTSRPTNDGDPAAEPGEIMKLGITLQNESSGTVEAVAAILKTTDTRVVGLDGDGNEIDLLNTGIEVFYGTFFGNASKLQTFELVQIKSDFAPLGEQVHFTLDVKSGENYFGSDEFDVKIGADIVVHDIDVDPDLKPGSAPQDITIELRNITSADIEDVRLTIDPSSRDVDIPNDRVDFDKIRAGNSEDANFETEVEADFAGYVTFTLEIEVDRNLINVDSFRYYFGGRTQYAINWVADDDNGNDTVEQGEQIKLQIALRNLTDEEAENVETKLSTTDDAVLTPLDEDEGDYRDVPAHTVKESRDAYEFAIGNAGDMSVNAPSGSIIGTDTFEVPDANWIPDALVGGELNPNTGQAETYEITGNTTDTITVDTTAKADMDTIALDGDSFTIEVEGAPFNDFELKGHPVEFTLDIEEDRDPAGQATFTLKIGGMIRYLTQRSYDDFIDTMSDAVSLDPAHNDGDGIPEPGETIEIEITLINIWTDDIDDIRVRLDSNDDVDVIIDDADYGEIRDGRTNSKVFKFQIDDNFEGNLITFTLEIEGDVDGSGEELGIEEFTVPVGQ